MKRLVVALILSFLAAGCAMGAVATSQAAGAQAPKAAEVSLDTRLQDEQQAEYWLHRAEETIWATKIGARTSLAQTYYLKLIYTELRRSNELLEKQNELLEKVAAGP